MLIIVDNRETELFPLIDRRIDTIDILEKESAAEAAAAGGRPGLQSALVAAGPAGAAGGSTPLAPAPHGVSIATVIQIGRAIPRTAASIIRYLWKALCFWGFSLFRYRAAISDSL